MSQTEEKIVKIVDTTTHSRGVSVRQVSSEGALVTTIAGMDSANLPGIQVPASDSIVVEYPSSTTELYTYKTGGISGTTVATITVTYTTSAKTILSSVEKVIP
jgi:hypothetical protein